MASYYIPMNFFYIKNEQRVWGLGMKYHIEKEHTPAVIYTFKISNQPGE